LPASRQGAATAGFRRWARIMPPIPNAPASIIAQVAGSGTPVKREGDVHLPGAAVLADDEDRAAPASKGARLSTPAVAPEFAMR
jgi:hypothetical protein